MPETKYTPHDPLTHISKLVEVIFEDVVLIKPVKLQDESYAPNEIADMEGLLPLFINFAIKQVHLLGLDDPFLSYLDIKKSEEALSGITVHYKDSSAANAAVAAYNPALFGLIIKESAEHLLRKSAALPHVDLRHLDTLPSMLHTTFPNSEQLDIKTLDALNTENTVEPNRF